MVKEKLDNLEIRRRATSASQMQSLFSAAISVMDTCAMRKEELHYLLSYLRLFDREIEGSVSISVWYIDGSAG